MGALSIRMGVSVTMVSLWGRESDCTTWNVGVHWMSMWPGPKRTGVISGKTVFEERFPRGRGVDEYR